jgi:hypothetical protein
MLPSKYSAQAIFQHHFQSKKCTLYLMKYGIFFNLLCPRSTVVEQSTHNPKTDQGAQKLAGDNLKVIWDEFPTLS